MRVALLGVLAACNGPREWPAVELAVGVGGDAADVTIVVDGAPFEDGQAGFEVVYDDIDAARIAPLVRIETWRDGALVDGIDLGFGACERLCADPEAHCVGVLTVREEVEAIFDAGGVFLPAIEDDPREWRGSGCLRCEFSDGFNATLCD